MESELSIRRRLSYKPWSCNLCSVSFFTLADAESHFHPDFSRHPGQQLAVSETIDPHKERLVQQQARPLASHPVGVAHQPTNVGSLDANSTGRGTVDEKNLEINKSQVSKAKIGSSACSRCGSVVRDVWESRRDHVRRKHLGRNMYRCKHCKADFAHAELIRNHIYRNHPNARLADASEAIDEVKAGEVRGLVAQCFPKAMPISSRAYRCGDCGRMATNPFEHVSVHHFRRPTFLCPKDHCPFRHTSFDGKGRHATIKHIQKQHPELGDTAPVDRREELREAVDRLARRLFPGYRANHSTATEGPDRVGAETAVPSSREGYRQCQLCRRSVLDVRDSRRSHVKTSHVDGKPLVCLVCPVRSASLKDAASHFATHHPELGERKLACRPAAEVAEMLGRCFPAGQEKAGIRCGGCPPDSVPVESPLIHVAKVHLRRPLFGCPHCDKTHTGWHQLGDMKQHIRVKHRGEAGLEPIDRREEFHPAVKELLRQHFPDYQHGWM